MTSFSSTIQRLNTTQLSIEEYIDISEKGINKEWFEGALRELETLCLTYDTFSVDTLHERLAMTGHDFADVSAIGAVMRQGKKHRWCKSTVVPVRSERPEAHGRFVMNWQSLLHNSY